MKTAMIDGTRKNIEFKTSTGIYTRCVNNDTGKAAQHGADIYTVDGDESVLVMVATAVGGSEMKASVKVITADKWSVLDDLRSAYNDMDFHLAVMRELDFDA